MSMLNKKSMYQLKTNILVFIDGYNSNYFKSSELLLNHLSLILNEYIDYRENNFGYDFLDFINDSIENNYDLNDSIEEIRNIKKTIKSLGCVELGQITIELYDIVVSHSYLFIYNTITKKSYKYYMD